jgi:hypothetical protein
MKEKTPYIVPFFILTAATLIFWAFFDIYRNIKKVPPVIVPPEVLAPINPKLDTSTLSELEKRFYIEDSQIEDTTYVPSNKPTFSSTPNARVTSTPMASASASPTPSASASATPQ